MHQEAKQDAQTRNLNATGNVVGGNNSDAFATFLALAYGRPKKLMDAEYQNKLVELWRIDEPELHQGLLKQRMAALQNLGNERGVSEYLFTFEQDAKHRALSDIWMELTNSQRSTGIMDAWTMARGSTVTALQWYVNRFRDLHFWEKRCIHSADAEEAANDFRIFDSLPAKFDVYRGVGGHDNWRGIAYTLDPSIAWDFVQRSSCESGHVYKRAVQKHHVWAFTNARQEMEIIYPPASQRRQLAEVSARELEALREKARCG